MVTVVVEAYEYSPDVYKNSEECYITRSLRRLLRPDVGVSVDPFCVRVWRTDRPEIIGERYAIPDEMGRISFIRGHEDGFSFELPIPGEFLLEETDARDSDETVRL